MKLLKDALLSGQTQPRDQPEQVAEIDDVFLGIKGETVADDLVDGGLAIGRLFFDEGEDVKFVEAIEVAAIHELAKGGLHFIERGGRGDLEANAVVIVAKIDTRKILLLTVEIDEFWQVVNRHQDRDKRIFER